MADSTRPQKWNALRKIVKRLPAHLAYYGSALGAIVLAGGGQLPLGLEFVAGSIGGNMLSNIISDILKDEDLLDDEIRQRAEEAIHKSNIANLLTKHDFLQGYARLIQRLDAQKTISQDILDELRTGFDKVATADQVEELKRLILQLMQQPPQVVTRKARLFISYARADDEPFVERLYHDLKDDFDIWWDRVTMSNRGKTFLQEIRDAIDRSDRLLLIAGPHAFTSNYVRDEWQYAYETYKGINITLRLGDYTDFPALLSNFDAPDFRSDANYNERLTTLKRQLAEPVAPIAPFHNVPALTPHFLNRPETLDALCELVISYVDKPTSINAEKRTTVLEGMGGMGKSVISTAFAHNRKVRFAFPDGIVWLSIGVNVSMFELYRILGTALEDNLTSYLDEATARLRLRKTLTDKKCLIILDDVWNIEHIEPFLDFLSLGSRILVTTRNTGLAVSLDAQVYRLDTLNIRQSQALLSKWTGQEASELPDLAMLIIDECGGLPFAISLVGAMVAQGMLWNDILSALLEADLEFIEAHLPNYPYKTILKTIKVSVNKLEWEESLHYHELVIFNQHSLIDGDVVVDYWLGEEAKDQAKQRYARKLINKLSTLNLIQPRDSSKKFMIHDLQKDYLRFTSLEQETNVTNLHDKVIYPIFRHVLKGDVGLLNLMLEHLRYAQGANASKLGYAINHLGHHLASARQFDRLKSLLCNFFWLQSKLLLGNVEEILLDFKQLALQSNLTEGDIQKHVIDSLADRNGIILGEKDNFPLNQDILEGLAYIESAINLSSSVLDRDKWQLASQLVGRLQEIDNITVKIFLNAIYQLQSSWLCPLSTSLLPASISKQDRLEDGQSIQNRIVSIRISEDNKTLIVLNQLDNVQYWDIHLKNKRQGSQNEFSKSISYDASFDGILIALIQSGSLEVINKESNIAVARFTADSPLVCYCFSGVDAQIFAGDMSGNIHFLAIKGDYK